MRLAELLHMCALGARTGRISVDTPRGPGYVFLENGVIVHCSFSGRQGEPALLDLLTQASDHSNYEDGVPTPMKERFRSCDQILLEAAHLIDQAKGGDSPRRATEVTTIQFPVAQLRIISELSDQVPYTLMAEVTRIGRIPDNDFVVPDSSVSAKHCTITRQRNRYFLEDLRSTNGTFIDGFRVDRAELQNGAVLQLGAIFVKFEIPTQNLPRRPSARTRHHDPAIKTAQLIPPPRPQRP